MKAELLISLRMSLTFSAVFVFCVTGVVAQDGWAVNYNEKSFCALKGSAVTMECTYRYPRDHPVQKAFWTKELVTSGSEPPDLSDDPEYRGRVQYLGDEHSDCTLRFKTVTEKDQSKYYFRFITDQPGGKYQGAGGVDLSVTDLQVEVPERVTEGDYLTLICKTTCSLTVRPRFSWYRNGHRLFSSTDRLHLQPVSREDAGRYHCAVLGLTSLEVTLNFKYLQVEVPERVIEGDKVTLTCITSFSLSDGPTFTWYKNGHPLSSSADRLHLQPVSREDAGRYHCAVLGQNLHSPEVTLNVIYGPKRISVSINPSGEIVEGSSVTLTCSSDANPPVEYNWFKGTSLVARGETYTMNKISSVDSGEYKCRSSNEHGEKLSEALTLNVLYPPKSISISITFSGKTLEGSSVTLTCSSDVPVQNYTWFKEGGISPVGSGNSYSFIFDSKSSGWNKKKKRTMEEDDHWNTDHNAKDDTYTALDPMSRSSDDVYNTLAYIDPNAKDNTYTALDPVSRSSDDVYNTLATVNNKR
ncbi:B-cell receptor CD22-like [Colossoma macropomum]|uniref:B-cell receptor CD22-like n=1 Tax=Colossoma macropomum TaxID=42526 RepID=UPI0018655D7F|nr:B-cell receptor CD22-like [Colossoma macropomum]